MSRTASALLVAAGLAAAIAALAWSVARERGAAEPAEVGRASAVRPAAASAEDGAPRDAREPIAPGPVEVADVVERARADDAVLAGVVRDGRGAPVAGAELLDADVASRLGRPPRAARGTPLATTGADGSFRVRRAHGPWGLLVVADGHPEELALGDAAPGALVEGLVIVLADGLAIEGRVVAAPDVLERAVVRALPLRAAPTIATQGAAPVVPQGGGPPLAREARVAEDGTFALRGLADGWRWRVAAWSDDRPATTDPDTEWVEAAPGARGVVLAIDPGTALLLRAVDAASGAPLETLDVRAGCVFLTPLVDAEGRPQRAFADGRVRVPVPDACGSGATVRVRVSAPGHAERTLEAETARNRALDLGAVALEPVASVAVRAVDALTGEPVVEADVAVFTPERFPPSDAPPWERARTDAEGRARVDVRPDGVLFVRPRAHALHVRELPRPAGEVELEIALGRGVRVEVEVVDRGGAPRPGAWVHRTNAGLPPIAPDDERQRADAGGRAVFDRVAPGSHRFRVVGADPRVDAGAEVEVEVVVEGESRAVRLVDRADR